VDDEDRDGAVVQDVVADAAHERGADGAAAARAHDDGVVVAVLDLPDQRGADRLLGQHRGDRHALGDPIARLLVTLGPRRITELAELERLAQPTLTQLVKRLEQQGLVSRERQTDDGRVVLGTLTPAGSAALDDFRARASAALSGYLVELSDEEVGSLAAATETLARLIALLQQDRGPVERPTRRGLGGSRRPSAGTSGA
jgi:DNA-binding MarR family transcriptional regulator